MPLTMISQSALQKLIDNAQTTLLRYSTSKSPPDHRPVVRLYVPGKPMSFLLAEYDPRETMFFGLSDLATGMVQLGSISLAKLKSRKIQPICVDHGFCAKGTLMDYLRESLKEGHL